MNKCIRKLNNFFMRHYATKPINKVIPDENVLNDINEKRYKPKKHPGIMNKQVVSVPETLVKAIKNVTEDESVKALIKDSKQLYEHLQYKVAPMEIDELKELANNAKNHVLFSMKDVLQSQNEADEKKYNQIIKDKVTYIMKQKVYNWRAINYDYYKSLLYLFARLPAEYAVLIKIFSEINFRDPQFKPKSLFDFGSGVGSVTWAVNEFWKNNIFEYFNVDASRDMNDLAQILLQGGRSTKQMSLKGVFFRQFLPSTHISYDLVVSAYTLLELPTRQSRLETVLNLWNKTGKYLIIVEQGSNAGFKIINEIRDYILHNTKNSIHSGHVFSPCPHDFDCPRFVANKNTTCHFQVKYFNLPIGEQYQVKSEKYSYVVFKKENRDLNDFHWPRIIRQPLIRSKHTICRMCTANGKIEEVIFTAAKHGKTTYHCARCTKWGDLLPMKIMEPEENQNKSSDNN